MAISSRQSPPVWFWIVADAFLLWQLIGCWAFYQHAVVGPTDPYEQQLAASMPGWYIYLFAAAILTGTLGVVALIARSKLAQPLLLVSLIAVVVQYGYVFTASDLIAHVGLTGAVGLPATIAILGAIQLWFARFSSGRGWIG